jgi:hypothetical protein
MEKERKNALEVDKKEKKTPKKKTKKKSRRNLD